MSLNELWIVARFAEPLAEALGEPPAGVRVRTAADVREIGDALEGVEALATTGQGLAEARGRMPRLRWLQALSAGTDHLAGIDLSGVALSTMAGAHVPQMSELAFLFMLALTRDMRRLERQQQERLWQPWFAPTLAGAHAVIVGTGLIAQGIALRARAFGMRVTGVSASPRPIEGFDAVVARERLAEVAREADHLLILAPLTDDTRGLVSRVVLEALPPHAVVVNLARGAVVDEEALIELLRAGRIAGAGLDVFTSEPLPANNPLWAMPNVLVSPHIGGWSSNLVEQLAPILRENIARWFGNPRRPLVNQQDGA